MGRQAGPYSIERLKERGYWRPETLVRKEGETAWVKIGDLYEEDLVDVPAIPVENSAQKPDPPEKLSREAERILFLVFPVYLLAIYYQDKADRYYALGQYERTEEYAHKVHTCLVVGIVFLFYISWLSRQERWSSFIERRLI